MPLLRCRMAEKRQKPKTPPTATRARKQTAKPARGPIETALHLDLERMHRNGELDERRGSLRELALLLARQIDVDAGPLLPALSKELRATITDLLKDDSPDDDHLTDLLARLSSPVGDQTQP